MKTATRIFYLVIFIITALYVFLAYRTGQEGTQYFDLGAEIKQIYPKSVEMLDETTVQYTIDIHDISHTSRSVSFFSSHEQVQLYCDGVITFERTTEPSVFGQNPGSAINIVSLPSDAQEIQVIFKDLYTDQVGNDHVFYYGNGQLIMDDYISKSLPAVFISLFIFEVGFLMFLFWAISRRSTLLEQQAAFHFGIFTMLLGLWNLNETDMALILMQDRMAASLFGYVLLLVMVYPCVQFARYYLESEESKSFYITTWTSFIGLLTLEGLQVFQVADFLKTATAFHILIMIGFAYIIYKAIYQSRRGLKKTKVYAMIIAAVALAVSAGLNFLAYYKGWGQTSVYSKLGMLIFILVLGLETMRNAFIQINDGKKAEVYKNMAYTDIMTGLNNRSAFEHWEQETTDFSGTEILTFDLNDLKLCNDTKGHAAGDTYITAVAGLIKDIFGSIGKCYRIGGDEFCVVLNKKCHTPMETLIKKFRSAEKKENYRYPDLDISVAVGYAVYDQKDSIFEDTRSRADKMMYNNKKELKNSVNI